MKTTLHLATVICATVILGSVAALGDDTVGTGTPRFAAPKPVPGQKIIATADYYTNDQLNVSSIQQSRVREAGPAPKGAMAMQSGTRIETRPPTSFAQPDPWIQSQHPWDIQSDLPAIDEGTTNNPAH